MDGPTFMQFHRKIANRILLAHLAPLPFVLIIGVALFFARGHKLHVEHFVGALAAGYLLGVAVGRLFTRQYTRRLAQLRRGAERIERGDYQARLPIGRDQDEFTDMARAFNHMADVIAAREIALREQNQGWPPSITAWSWC